MTADLVWFALERDAGFVQDLSNALRAAPTAHEDLSFEDGEHKLRPLASVRGRDVYIVDSLYGQDGETVHDKLVKLLFFVGALNDAAAARVTAVVPYLAYARKDRKSRPRDPVSTRYVAQLMEAVGTHCVATLDVHNLAAFQNAFRCRTEHLEANPLFVEHFAARVGTTPVTVISPDAGGIKRAEAFRQRLEQRLRQPVGMGFAEKHRSGGVVSGEAFTGDVDGRTVIVIDDLIATGTTLARTAETCRRRGAARVHCAATHGAFSPDANSALATDAIASLVVTDSVPPLAIHAEAVRGKLERLSCTGLVAEAIRRLHTDGSIVELLGQ